MKALSAQVCVVGSGAGGSTVFDYLAASGVDVIMLEQGSRLPPEDLPPSIARRTALTYRNGGLQAVFGNAPFPFGEGCLLGGSTEVNGGLFWYPPGSVIRHWRQTGFHPELGEAELLQIWEQLVLDLSAGSFPAHDPVRDADSELMSRGFRAIGHTTTSALRLAPNCQRSNLCPSVCPTGAKNSMSRTLIPRGESRGGRVITEVQVLKILSSKGRSKSVYCKTPEGQLKLECQAVVLAAGAIRTPGLLGTLTRQRVFPLGLHLNAKLIARFPEPIRAESSTIFTLQAQDWLEEGFIAMPANLRPEYLAMGMGSASNESALGLLRDIDYLGLYTVQIRPDHDGRIFRPRGSAAVPWWWITNGDTELARKGISYLACALFAAGAIEVRLPLRGVPTARSLAECEKLLQAARPTEWLFTSVHAMSSLPMGTLSPFCDAQGQVPSQPGVWVADASALPTTVGESPQGAIMLHALATSRVIAEQFTVN